MSLVNAQYRALQAAITARRITSDEKWAAIWAEAYALHCAASNFANEVIYLEKAAGEDGFDALCVQEVARRLAGASAEVRAFFATHGIQA